MREIKQTFYYIILVLLMSHTNVGRAEDYTLPIYKIEIDSEYLELLSEDPWSSRTYPAIIEYEGERYDCRVRYRGTSGRLQPKKSWKLFFDDISPLNREVINLNSEYRDRTISRNHLAMKLASSIGLDVPETRHISLMVNGIYFGVYVELENIDEEFFEQRDISEQDLFKALSHVARFTPLTEPFDIKEVYEPKIIGHGSLDTLGKRLAYFHYSPPGIDLNELNRIINIDNFIKYFAIMYCICNHDGFSKNYYLWRQNDNRYSIIPWDCDATFGNEAWGSYIGFEDKKTFDELVEQSVFQHMIAVPEFRQRLLQNIDYIVHDGFQLLEEYMHETFNQIRHDAYFDTLRRGDNDSFDYEWQRLHRFISQRRIYLQDLDWFYRFNVEEFTFEPEYLGDDDSNCRFEVRLEEVPVLAQVAILESNNAEVRLSLNDYGENGDRIAGDLVYSIEFDVSDYSLPISFGVVVSTQGDEYFTHPPAGWHRLGDMRYPLPVLNHKTNPPGSGDISFGIPEVDPAGTFRIPIINNSTFLKDLSGCQFRLGSGFRRLSIPQSTIIPPGDTLYVTNHLERAEYIFPGDEHISRFYYEPNEGDTLLLTSPSANVLAESIVNKILNFSDIPSSIVINEINYQSADNYDSGDWIELFTFKKNINLSHWKLTDSDADHVFIFPPGTYMDPNSYLIIARDIDRFEQVHTEVQKVIGDYDFGFSNNFDDVKLYDERGVLVDWVAYSNEGPWQSIPAQSGGTLELINPRMPNYAAVNWHVSGWGFPFGTPGAENSLHSYDRTHSDFVPLPEYTLLSAYPNPFNGRLFFIYSAPSAGTAKFKIYDSIGRQVSTFSKPNARAGYFKADIDLSKSSVSSLSAGSYFLQIESKNSKSYKQVIYLP